jgi:hypothetical protein
VFAVSSFAHDRLGDLLYREGKLTREQHVETRALAASSGRELALKLVDLGLLKSGELFSALRRQTEEIVYSLFAWEEGRFRLTQEQVAVEDRLRLSLHPTALVLEGVRRKYGLERLLDELESPELVVRPAPLYERALLDAALSANERQVIQLIDGERTVAELRTQLRAQPSRVEDTTLYTLLVGLLAVGALERAEAKEEASTGDAVDAAKPHERKRLQAAPTLVGDTDVGERRRVQRKTGDEPADRAIERDRVAAKRAQLTDCDYFAVLGVEHSASAYEIDRAYARAKEDFARDRFHPELVNELGEAIDEIREVLDEAHRILMDDAVRGAYRSHLVNRDSESA